MGQIFNKAWHIYVVPDKYPRLKASEQLEGSTIREQQGQRRKRPRSTSVEDESEKENRCKVRRKIKGNNAALREVLEERKELEKQRIEQARARDSQRQSELVDRLDRMTDGIAALTEITRQKMEQDREQQGLMKMLVEAVLKK
ncbi:hypothetical protein NMY22_g6925 [Coprinellus aureogranulatus]|nr:hypothetical protein NMY22_g6925 [Coprinellus aureogranulatus]